MIECIFYDSNCYAYGKANKCLYYNNTKSKSQIEGVPKGIIVHSTGVNQTKLARFVQPSESDPNCQSLLSIIGKNSNNNHWNKPTSNKCVHAMIGKNSSGNVITVQTLPFEYCCWGVGAGEKGSYNYNPNAYIQFEMLEDDLTDEKYFNSVIKEAIELCKTLCKRYNIPIENIKSHQEAGLEKMGSKHVDPSNWLSKFGKDMNWFRGEVGKMYQVNDEVKFCGTVCHSNSGGGNEKEATAGKAIITQIASGAKYPYHVKYTEGSESNVWGWVREQDVCEWKIDYNALYEAERAKNDELNKQLLDLSDRYKEVVLANEKLGAEVENLRFKLDEINNALNILFQGVRL